MTTAIPRQGQHSRCVLPKLSERRWQAQVVTLAVLRGWSAPPLLLSMVNCWHGGRHAEGGLREEKWPNAQQTCSPAFLTFSREGVNHAGGLLALDWVPGQERLRKTERRAPRLSNPVCASVRLRVGLWPGPGRSCIRSPVPQSLVLQSRTSRGGDAARQCSERPISGRTSQCGRSMRSWP